MEGAPDYWDEAARALAARDPVLGGVIARHPGIHLVTRGDAFTTLARSIVGQQISVKAAQSVWDRLCGRLVTLTPAALARTRKPALRHCGLSERKADYLKDLARKFLDGDLDPARWPALDDETLISELVAVKGIGRWTAEMFLIFHMQRPDVLPVGDLGLRRAIGERYADGRQLSLEEIHGIAAPWRPWRTVATWYLWRSLDPIAVDY